MHLGGLTRRGGSVSSSGTPGPLIESVRADLGRLGLVLPEPNRVWQFVSTVTAQGSVEDGRYVLDFWGKARPDSDNPAALYHPVTFHSLDVAACAFEILLCPLAPSRRIIFRLEPDEVVRRNRVCTLLYAS